MVDMPQGWVAAIRAGDIAALDRLYGRAEEGCGHTVFVAGDDAAGRDGLVRAWAARVGEGTRRPRVVGGSFVDGRYEPWPAYATTSTQSLQRLEQALRGAGVAVDVLDIALPGLALLLGQLLSLSEGALQVACDVLGTVGADGPGSDLVLGRVLRRVCDAGPAVVVLEEPDEDAGGLWVDLAALLGRRIAQLPLLLVIAVDGPEHLGAGVVGEPGGWTVARGFTDDGLGTWHHLPPLGTDDLRRLTGPAAPDVLGLLATLSGGRAGVAVQLWQEWRGRGVVEDTSRGEWRLTRVAPRAMDDVEWLVAVRLQGVYGKDRLEAIATAGMVLECAALEGARFTAPAIALALRRDVDETIDLLDDTLLADELHPHGFVADEGFVTIADERGTRHLATYGFARKTDWLALRHLARGAPGGGRDLQGRVADALERCYGAAAGRIAPTLRRLFAQAGDRDRAAYYERMARNAIGATVVLWRARLTLADDAPHDLAARRRAFQALMDASDVLFHGGPFDDALRFALAADEVADVAADHAAARYNAGCHEINLGQHAHAATHLTHALKICRELGDRHGEADALHALAVIEQAQGRYDAACEQFSTVLTIRRELGDRRGEADALHELAVIEQAQGRDDAAREQFSTVLTICRELRDRRGEAAALHALAVIEQAQGRYDAACEQFSTVLTIRRELGDRRGEAAALRELAVIERAQGRDDAAREQFSTVLTIRRELRDRHGEAAALHELEQLGGGV